MEQEARRVGESDARQPGPRWRPDHDMVQQLCVWLRLAEGKQYRAVLSVADLEALAERYGNNVPFVDFRARLRCPHCGSSDVSTIINTRHATPQERWERKTD